jgi:GDP-L-fucose synthase
MNILITGGSGFVGSSLSLYFSTFKPNYNIFAPTHQELDLYNFEKVKTYIRKHNIEHVINAAYIITRYYKTQDIKNIYNNLLMFENILTASYGVKTFINFGSGAEFDITKDISEKKESEIYNIVPCEYGGFSKSVIAKRLLTVKHPKCYNLRFFGSFGYLEANDRFIKNNLINIIANKPITIHQNRFFDFIYINDLALIVDAILNNSIIHNNINCVYQQKYTLLDIASILLNITNKSVDIIIQQDGMGLSYTGDGTLLSEIGLNLCGLKRGITETYKKLENSI